MTIIDVDQLAKAVRSSLSAQDLAHIEIELLGVSGFKAVVDGPYCLNNVHIWPVGTGYSEYVYCESEEGSERHVEFASLQDAAEWARSEILAALVRARGKEYGNAT